MGSGALDDSTPDEELAEEPEDEELPTEELDDPAEGLEPDWPALDAVDPVEEAPEECCRAAAVSWAALAPLGRPPVLGWLMRYQTFSAPLTNQR